MPARITNPARTVVDCFRFRRIVGMDVALEAIRDTLARRIATPTRSYALPRHAARSRWSGPVLEALLA